MAGADGVIMEVHHTPEKAFSDGQQTLSHKESDILIKNLMKTFRFREEL
jgi:3-deoxy-7-phosphoheptulonate synthase